LSGPGHSGVARSGAWPARRYIDLECLSGSLTQSNFEATPGRWAGRSHRIRTRLAGLFFEASRFFTEEPLATPRSRATEKAPGGKTEHECAAVEDGRLLSRESLGFSEQAADIRAAHVVRDAFDPVARLGRISGSNRVLLFEPFRGRTER
jgi:hypothetical protein